MAKISLRAYNREIETLVERGQSEEAVAHCKFILKTYPKHLDTYRLLGKAFLESQRYTEAADILQRILSVQPDDFVAQIGSSIIREDEGNLDAALFHMERAFEIQPSNAAIQDELRRLYGRRDGVEPPKLRLTRGALVRMYARGDLYRQAIAEARAAIAEDTQRLDLNIILAKMYFLLGQKAEAAEISSKLVAKLPFCYEANRILAEVLPGTSRAEDAKIYQHRLLSLDPYLGYISKLTPSITQVPDQAVTIDRLDWTQSLDTDQQPAWAKSLDISIDAQPEEEKADGWMASLSMPAETRQPESIAFQSFSEETNLSSTPVSDQIPSAENQTHDHENESEEIPGWMSSAGWNTSDPLVEESPALAPAESESIIGEDAQPASVEIPDWLKGFTPFTKPTAPTPPEDKEKLDWFSTIIPEESDLSLENIEVTQPNPVAPTAPSTPAFISPVNEELPDWMRSGTPYSDETANQFATTEEPLPDWLTEATEQTDKIEPFSPMNTLETPNIEQTQPQAAAQLPVAEPSLISPALVEAEPAPEPDLSNPDDAMGWLESLAVKQGAGEESLLTKPDQRQDQPPEWVTAAARSAELEEHASETIPLEQEQIFLSQKGIPQPESTAETEQFVAPPALEPEDTRPTSLAGLHSETEPSPIKIVNDILPSQAIANLPTSTLKLHEDQSGPEAALTPEPAPTEPVNTDMDAAFAWLESLAAQQGAQDSSLFIAPEERPETPPDWVKEASNEMHDELPAVDAANQPETEEWIPEWKKSSEDSMVSEQDEIPQSQEMPDWLKALEASPDSTIDAITPLSDVSTAQDEEISSPKPASEDESAGWILDEQGTSSSIIDETAQGNQGNSTPVKPADTLGIESFISGITGPLPTWLAARATDGMQSLPEPKFINFEGPTLPNWLQAKQPATSAGDETIPIEPSSSKAPPLPEWLQNIEPEKVEVPNPETPPTSSTPSSLNVEFSSNPVELIKQAEIALSGGQIDSALTAYNTLIQNDQQIEETIHDLRDALYRFPVESSIWQTLGDALIRANRVQEALDAYTKAEELLK